MPSVLFLVLIIQLIGFTAYFEVSHYLIRKEVKSIIKQGVPEENRVIFTFTSAQMNSLQWVKKNEFRLGKRMYDVIETKTLANGTTELQCISDIQEERLFANLSFSVGRNMGDDQHSTPYTTLFKIIQTPALLNKQPAIVEVVQIAQNLVQYFTYTAPVSEEFRRSMEQPPCTFC
ncbi:MAG: hypothetical protein RL632_1944 [Bacteroidota bacterium]|jgi:hypothetical protein